MVVDSEILSSIFFKPSAHLPTHSMPHGSVILSEISEVEGSAVAFAFAFSNHYKNSGCPILALLSARGWELNFQ
jgi:hypothetical protein